MKTALTLHDIINVIDFIIDNQQELTTADGQSVDIHQLFKMACQAGQPLTWDNYQAILAGDVQCKDVTSGHTMVESTRLHINEIRDNAVYIVERFPTVPIENQQRLFAFCQEHNITLKNIAVEKDCEAIESRLSELLAQPLETAAPLQQWSRRLHAQTHPVSAAKSIMDHLKNGDEQRAQREWGADDDFLAIIAQVVPNALKTHDAINASGTYVIKPTGLAHLSDILHVYQRHIQLNAMDGVNLLVPVVDGSHWRLLTLSINSQGEITQAKLWDSKAASEENPTAAMAQKLSGELNCRVEDTYAGVQRNGYSCMDHVTKAILKDLGCNHAITQTPHSHPDLLRRAIMHVLAQTPDVVNARAALQTTMHQTADNDIPIVPNAEEVHIKMDVDDTGDASTPLNPNAMRQKAREKRVETTVKTKTDKLKTASNVFGPALSAVAFLGTGAATIYYGVSSNNDTDEQGVDWFGIGMASANLFTAVALSAFNIGYAAAKQNQQEAAAVNRFQVAINLLAQEAALHREIAKQLSALDEQYRLLVSDDTGTHPLTKSKKLLSTDYKNQQKYTPRWGNYALMFGLSLGAAAADSVGLAAAIFNQRAVSIVSPLLGSAALLGATVYTAIFRIYDAHDIRLTNEDLEKLLDFLLHTHTDSLLAVTLALNGVYDDETMKFFAPDVLNFGKKAGHAAEFLREMGRAQNDMREYCIALSELSQRAASLDCQGAEKAKLQQALTQLRQYIGQLLDNHVTMAEHVAQLGTNTMPTLIALSDIVAPLKKIAQKWQKPANDGQIPLLNPDEIETVKNVKQQMDVRLRHIDDELDALNTEIARQRAEIQTLKDERIKDKAEIQTLKDERIKDKAEIQTLKDERASDKAEIARQRAEIQTLKDERIKDKAEIQILKDDMRSLKDNIQTQMRDFMESYTHQMAAASKKESTSPQTTQTPVNRATTTSDQAESQSSTPLVGQSIFSPSNTSSTAHEGHSRSPDETKNSDDSNKSPKQG